MTLNAQKRYFQRRNPNRHPIADQKLSYVTVSSIATPPRVGAVQSSLGSAVLWMIPPKLCCTHHCDALLCRSRHVSYTNKPRLPISDFRRFHRELGMILTMDCGVVGGPREQNPHGNYFDEYLVGIISLRGMASMESDVSV